MRRAIGTATAALLLLAGAAHADGFYNLLGPGGDKWGEIAFMDTVGDDTVWVWPTEEGDVTFYIANPSGGQDGWSQGTYSGFFTTDLPEEIDPPCQGAPVTDPNGGRSRQWGNATFEWSDTGRFMLRTWPCGGALGLELNAEYAWGG